MNFHIHIINDRKRYHFLVEHTSDKDHDYYKVIARNGFITFSNNVPFLRSKNLKKKRPQWSVIGNDIWNVTFKQKIIQAITIHQNLPR